MKTKYLGKKKHHNWSKKSNNTPRKNNFIINKKKTQFGTIQNAPKIIKLMKKINNREKMVKDTVVTVEALPFRFLFEREISIRRSLN